MWSMWSLKGDHIAGTAFLYKIVPGVNLQKFIRSTSNVQYLVCNKNNNNLKLSFNPSVENTFIVFGIDIWLILLTRQISHQKTTHVFSTDRLNTHLFLLYEAVFYVCSRTPLCSYDASLCLLWHTLKVTLPTKYIRCCFVYNIK